MNTYTIESKRVIYLEHTIEAESEDEALRMAENGQGFQVETSMEDEYFEVVSVEEVEGEDE